MKGGDEMRYIDELFDMIADEIEVAEKYAEKFIQLKMDKKDDWAEVFEEMTKNSIEHTDSLYTYINIRIKELKDDYTLPVALQKQWNYRNSQYKEKIAIIEQLISM